MGQIKIKDIIIDSLKYSASDLKVLVLLGIVLLIADLGDELSFLGDLSETARIVISIAIILLAIFEAGYVFRIIEETIHGSNILPRFNNFREMFSHGLNEMIVLMIYFVFPILFLLIIIFNYLISYDIDDISGGTGLIIILFIGVVAGIYLLFPAVILHRAHHNGDLRSSFDLRAIYHKIRNVGLKRLVIVYFSIFAIVALIRELFVPSMIDGPLPFFGAIISDLFIAPYLLIFTSRILGLLDN